MRLKRVYQWKEHMPLYARLTVNDVVWPAPHARPQPRPLLSSLITMLALWRRARRTRQQLGTLNDRELADVGLSQAQQRDEYAKPFWQL